MNALLPTDTTMPRAALEGLIARHGVWRILMMAAAVAMKRRPPVAPGIDVLSDHLRRDVGLPPRDVGWALDVVVLRQGR